MILPVLTGASVSVEPKSDKAHFFTYGYKFSGKNINVEFLPKIPGNIPTHTVWDGTASLEDFGPRISSPDRDGPFKSLPDRAEKVQPEPEAQSQEPKALCLTGLKIPELVLLSLKSFLYYNVQHILNMHIKIL